MENKIITALRFASIHLGQLEVRFGDLIKKEALTPEESLELTYLSNMRARLAKSCEANDLLEICEAVDIIIKNYAAMKRRGKKHFTVRLIIHESYADP